MSGRNFFMVERRARVQELIRMMQNNPDTPITKIRGLFSLKTGLSHNRIKQYLFELEESGLIEFDAEKQNYKILLG